MAEATIDPVTGCSLPPETIQRVLFIATQVHVYNIPPLTSTKGYVASSWTADNNKRQIFTARLRILETAIPTTNDTELLQAHILLEDSSTGELFAAAPYTTTAVVEQVLDSSRFFALRVEGQGGRKAILGIGFEDRSEAFDFSVSLQELGRTLGIEDNGKVRNKKTPRDNTPMEKKDFSLKEGETITLNLNGRRFATNADESSLGASQSSSAGAVSPLLPPPPSAQEVKALKRLSQQMEIPQTSSIESLGFDDGEFGEFQ